MIIDKKEGYRFELVLQVRDMLGNPTGKTKSYSSNNSYDIYKFWLRNRINLIKKNKGGVKMNNAVVEKIIGGDLNGESE